MVPLYISVATDGKVYVSGGQAEAQAVANVSHVYCLATPGKQPQLLSTTSGAGSPYTITSAALNFTDGREIIIQ